MAVEFSAPDTAQSPVGDIRKLVGDAWIDGVFGERLVEREGMVYQFDRIIVGEASSVVLRFTDGGVLILGPGAEAVISSYFLDVNGAAGGIDLTILEGAFYFAHGLIGSSVLGRVALETPLGVIEAEDSIFFGDLLTGNGAGFISIIEGFASLTRSGATVDLEEGVSAVFRDSTQEGLYSAFGDALIVPDDFQDRYAEFFAEVPFLQQRLVESLERAGQSLPDGATDNQGRDLVEERTAPQRSWWRNAETEDSLSEYDSTVVGGTILAAEARPTTFSSPGPSPFSFADSDLDPNESGPGTSVPDLQFTLTVADDIFLLSGGNDRITGTAVTLNPGDELVGGGGSDSLTLMGGGVFDLAGLNQFAEFETVALDDSGSSLMLRDGVDLAVVTGAGADAVTLGTGNDAVNLSGGNDTLMAVAATLNAGDDLRGGLGSDSLMLTGGGLFDLSGLAQVAGLEAVALDNSGSDLVLREGTDLIVTAGSGVDRITLGSGNDTVDLGGGDDSFNAASSSFNPGDDLDGGLGTDTLALTGGGAFDLSALAQVVGLEIVTLDDSGSSLTLRDGVDLTIAAGTAADSITLGSGDDIVDLGGDDDTLRAAAAALNPGDDLDGGAGTDTLILTTAGVYDISGLGQVVGLEAIRTTGDTDLTLGNATNTVAGGSAADTVNLGTGGDVIALAGGNDTIRADAATLGPGDDLDGGLGTDSLALTGGGAFDLSGLAQFAGFEVVTLDDIGSNLTLRDGTDVAVTAGTGADAVTLGSGNDTLDLGSGDDTIDAAAGTLNPGDDLVGGAGTDTLTLSSAGTYDLSALAQVSGLEAIRTTGSTDLTLNNATGVVVTLDNAANTVLGGAAADTVVLGSSSDNLNLAGGDDTISAVAATFNPGDALDGGLGTDSLALTGGGAFDLSGLAGFVNIEAVTLDDSGSGLTLRDGVDLTVTAGTGVDTVTLGTGGDTLDLGAGNDTIAAISTTLNATDSLDGGLGTDSLALTGGGAFDLSGLAGFVNIEAVTLDDSGSDLTLLDGVNLTVAAGTGVDTVTLGTGDDTLDLGAGNDTIAATSTTLNATDSLDGGLGTDSLALTGGGAFDLSGLAGFVNIEAVTLDDSGSDLTLRDGVDLTVTAGTGVDTVTLGTGDDTLDLGAGNDTIAATSTTLNATDDLDGGLGTDS
ncbi:MAG: calcium-binding protein, partial [Kiloniellaceae bacterium]